MIEREASFIWGLRSKGFLTWIHVSDHVCRCGYIESGRVH